MMNTQISVIVPVYNVAPYLRSCLDSLCKQLDDRVELILVNDGSTDDSEEIISEYATKYPVIRVIRQENMGLGAARNAGLDTAEGDFIWFVDSDDEVVSDALGTLQHMLTKYQEVDMLRFGYTRFNDSYGETVKVFQPSAAGPLPAPEYFQTHEMMHEACMGLYRRNYLLENHLRFAEGSIFEDTIFNMEAYSSGGSLAVVPLTLYRYRIREGSLSKSVTSLKKIESVVFLLKVCDRILAKNTRNIKAVSFVAAKKLDFLILLTDHLYCFSGFTYQQKRKVFLSVDHKVPVFRRDSRGIIIMKLIIRRWPGHFFGSRFAGLKKGWLSTNI